ncbi:MAG TPA: LysM peptidoglycan-binding domain-containing protein [Thermodesulfobacteriota bacterium]|nr:LysM peptidoglycan-binding domain-containing protein [Thermodesulfobacteriota bacterium]
MEKKEPSEDRVEPRVEVDPDLEFEEQRGPDWAVRPAPEKKPITRWVLGPILVAALAALGYAFWLIWGMSPLPSAKPSVPPEIVALRGEVQKLNTDLGGLTKDLGDLKAEQKTTAQKLAGLQGQLANLSKKMESAAAKKIESPPAKKIESAPAKKIEKAQEKKPVRKTFVYKIRPGDTLPSVAKKFGVVPEDIRRWNNLSPKAGLEVGQLLTIYSGATR